MGLATKSAEYFISNSFFNLELNKVENLCASGNTGSQKIANRLGGKLCGILRSNEVVSGEFFDHNAYFLLKSEWIKKYELTS